MVEFEIYEKILVATYDNQKDVDKFMKGKKATDYFIIQYEEGE